jgi:hypothetical protein
MFHPLRGFVFRAHEYILSAPVSLASRADVVAPIMFRFYCCFIRFAGLVFRAREAGVTLVEINSIVCKNFSPRSG